MGFFDKISESFNNFQGYFEQQNKKAQERAKINAVRDEQRAKERLERIELERAKVIMECREAEARLALKKEKRKLSKVKQEINDMTSSLPY